MSIRQGNFKFGVPVTFLLCRVHPLAISSLVKTSCFGFKLFDLSLYVPLTFEPKSLR